MSILLLTEADVRDLLTMEMALDAVESALRTLTLSEGQNQPRVRSQTDHAMLHVMSAAAKSLGVMGYKAYSTSKKGAHFHVGVFDGKSGELAAIVQADYLGQVRTGAASGVASKFLARPEASTVGLFGASKQARTQLLAMCKVRAIKHVYVYSRNEDNRRAFCEEMSRLCECAVEPATRPEDAARDRDIVITATNSRDPVFEGAWLADGTHVNAIGSNFWAKAEIDVATVKRAKTIVIDSREQGRIEAGDFREAIEKGVLNWADVSDLGEIIAGRRPGRVSAQDVTIFKSLGLAVEDIATAAAVIAKAKSAGVGRWIEW